MLKYLIASNKPLLLFNSLKNSPRDVQKKKKKIEPCKNKSYPLFFSKKELPTTHVCKKITTPPIQ